MNLQAMMAESIRQNGLLLKAMADQGMLTKAPATIGTGIELHGNGSLFGSNPIERDVITAHMRPLAGLASQLPLYGSVAVQPLYSILTGFTGTTGSRPTNPCDPQPSGFMKACDLTAQFGRVGHDTNTIDVNQTMLKKNRGDFTDLRLMGSVLGTEFNPSGMNEQQILNMVIMAEMVTSVVATQRDLTNHLWQGTPANNTGGGGYKEFPGLDVQIATGHVDATTGSTCSAVDSDVRSFAYNAVDGTDMDIVTELSSMMFSLEYNAQNMGLDPVTYRICMRPDLWWELSAVWPCRYLTNRCATSSGSNPMVINDNTNTAMRDDMRRRMVIPINGMEYQVVTDTGIYENNNINNANLGAGEYASTIYAVPLTILGSYPVCYREYVDYSQAQAQLGFLRNMVSFWTDRGIYSWSVEEVRSCIVLAHATEQRAVLRTPHLGGRIDYVKYVPTKHLRDADPDSPYWQDGGVSVRSDTSVSAVWL